MSPFPSILFTIIVFSLCGEYVVDFFFLDGVVLPCDHERLGFLHHQLIYVRIRSINQSINQGDKTLSVCVCVCCHPIYSGRQVCGRITSRGQTGGRSHGISPPSFCGTCLIFSREKDSAIPFFRRP